MLRLACFPKRNYANSAVPNEVLKLFRQRCGDNLCAAEELVEQLRSILVEKPHTIEQIVPGARLVVGKRYTRTSPDKPSLLRARESRAARNQERVRRTNSVLAQAHAKGAGSLEDYVQYLNEAGDRPARGDEWTVSTLKRHLRKYFDYEPPKT